jgi:hypothetical protein
VTNTKNRHGKEAQVLIAAGSVVRRVVTGAGVLSRMEQLPAAMKVAAKMKTQCQASATSMEDLEAIPKGREQLDMATTTKNNTSPKPKAKLPQSSTAKTTKKIPRKTSKVHREKVP